MMTAMIRPAEEEEHKTRNKNTRVQKRGCGVRLGEIAGKEEEEDGKRACTQL